MQGDGEYLDKIKLQQFWTALDQHAIELRTEAIRRLALGMDMPPEILTGTADVNHWGSWQIEEAAIKSHVDPLLQSIVSSLTEGYLRPILKGDVEDPEEYSFGVDTSDLRLRPNRSKEAIELYQLLELSGAKMLQENGFDVADQMKDDERRNIIIRRLSEGSPSPEQVAAAAAMLGITLPVTEDAGELKELPTPRGSLEDHPRRGTPETQEKAIAAAATTATLTADIERARVHEWDSVVYSAEVMVHRALERCGNRLKSKFGSRRPPEGVAACDLYRLGRIPEAWVSDLLEDAWTMVERFDLGVPSEDLTATLDYFTRGLIMNQEAYTREALQAAIVTAFGRDAA